MNDLIVICLYQPLLLAEVWRYISQDIVSDKTFDLIVTEHTVLMRQFYLC